jgi:hypothetical protein
MKNSASMFRSPDAPKSVRNPQIPLDAKTKVWHNMSGALFVKPIPLPSQHGKYCIGVSHPGRTGMHYVTYISQWMQKHKFSITCPGALFVESVPVLPEHEK